MRKREFGQGTSAAAGIAVKKNPRFEFSRQHQQQRAMVAADWYGQDRGFCVPGVLRPVLINGDSSSSTSATSTNSSGTIDAGGSQEN